MRSILDPLRRSLAGRVAAAVLLGALVGVVADNLVAGRALDRAFAEAERQDLSAIAQTFAADFEAADLRDPERLVGRLRRLQQFERGLRQASVMARTSDGRLLVFSTDPTNSLAAVNPRELGSLGAGQETVGREEEGGEPTLQLLSPLPAVDAPGGQTAVLELELGLGRYLDAQRTLARPVFVVIGVIGLALAVGLLAFLLLGLVMPIGRLQAGLRRIRQGDRLAEVELEDQRLDVIGELARDLETILGAHAREASELQLKPVWVLAAAVDVRDGYTAAHSRRVAEYAERLGQRLGLSPDSIANLRVAGLLHDVGKIGVPDSILRKPGPLTAAERTEIELHSEVGERLIAAAGFPEPARWVRHLHERLGGGGYPDGLRGDELPHESRLLAVADAWESMTTDRPYRRALPVETALAELEANRGTQFDPEILDALAELFEAGELASVASEGAAQPA